jgi:hypothetical protein
MHETHETDVAAGGIDPHHERTIGVVKALIDLDDARYAAEPEDGADDGRDARTTRAAKAAAWRAKLAE